jgi:hypothetical protein
VASASTRIVHEQLAAHPRRAAHPVQPARRCGHALSFGRVRRAASARRRVASRANAASAPVTARTPPSASIANRSDLRPHERQHPRYEQAPTDRARLSPHSHRTDSPACRRRHRARRSLITRPIGQARRRLREFVGSAPFVLRAMRARRSRARARSATKREPRTTAKHNLC